MPAAPREWSAAPTAVAPSPGIISRTMPDVLHHTAPVTHDATLLQVVRRAARNATWLFSSQTAGRLLGFLAGTMIARGFGAERFGEYMFVMTYVMYFAFLADGGLGRFLIRDSAREPMRAPELLAKVTSLRLVLACAVYVLMLLGAVATRTDGVRTVY